MAHDTTNEGLGDLYVIAGPNSDSLGRRVLVRDSDGSWVTHLSGAASATERFDGDIVVSSEVGTLWVTLKSTLPNYEVRVFPYENGAWGSAIALPTVNNSGFHFKLGADHQNDNILGVLSSGQHFNSDLYVYERSGSSWDQLAILEKTSIASNVYQMVALGVERTSDGVLYVMLGWTVKSRSSRSARLMRLLPGETVWERYATSLGMGGVAGSSRKQISIDERNGFIWANSNSGTRKYSLETAEYIEEIVRDSTYGSVVGVAALWSSDTVGPVASYRPRDGGVTGDENTDIQIGFDEPIRSDAVGGLFTNSQLEGLVDIREDSAGGAAIGHTLSISPDQRTITINPSGVLADGLVYVGLTADYWDPIGNRGLADSMTFTVNTSVASAMFIPGDGDATSEKDGAIKVVFSKPVFSNATGTVFIASTLRGLITIKRGGPTGQNIGIDPPSINVENTVVSVQPQSDIQVGKVYVAVSDAYFDEDGTRGTEGSAEFTVYDFRSNLVRTSRVSMLGIQDYGQGVRAAKDRVNILSRRRRVLLSGMDEYAAYRIGDTIEFPESAGEFSGRYIVVESPSRLESGLWRLRLHEYGEGSPYSDDTPDTPIYEVSESVIGPGDSDA